MLLRRTQSRLIVAAAIALTTIAPITTAQDAPPQTPTNDVAALKQALFDPSLRQDQRDQTAQRLLSRRDPAARTAIVDALQQISQPTIQLAAARALSDDPTADPAVVNPLFALLDANSTEPLIDAAAHALTAFKTNDDVLTRVLSLARDGTDERVRVAAIRAAGTFVDLRVGQTLIDLLDPTAQSPKINAAAAEGLTYLSGLERAHLSNDEWRKWWNDNRSKSAVQFRADVDLARGPQYDSAKAAVVDLQMEFQRILSDQYQRTPRDQRAEALVRYLRSTEPAVRVVGCRIAAEAPTKGEVPPPAVNEQLRQLIGDASPDVRRESANALALINDPAALTPLLTQLGQETDPAARAALIDALRPIGDVRAAPVLLSMLDDPSTDVAQSAAGALGEREFGQKLRQSNPNLAEDAARKLMQTLQTRSTLQNNSDLRYALVQAMIPLQSKSLEPAFVRMLSQPAELPRIRRSLLAAVGEMHDPQMADAIAPWLNDRDTQVKLAAIKALGNSADSLSAYERPLSDLIDPAKEPLPEVRDAAWGVLSSLFPKAQPNLLSQWEQKLKADPVKLLIVLREERSRARVLGDDAVVASRNQQIGDALSAASQIPNAVPQWNDAIFAYKDALSYATRWHNNYMIEVVSDGLTKAYLASRQYELAVNFVQAQIQSNPELEGTLGPDLCIEAERLVNDSKDYDASLQLGGLALKMSPKLKPSNTQRLEDLLKLVKKRNGEQNLTPFPPIERSLNA